MIALLIAHCTPLVKCRKMSRNPHLTAEPDTSPTSSYPYHTDTRHHRGPLDFTLLLFIAKKGKEEKILDTLVLKYSIYWYNCGRRSRGLDKVMEGTNLADLLRNECKKAAPEQLQGPNNPSRFEYDDSMVVLFGKRRTIKTARLVQEPLDDRYPISWVFNDQYGSCMVCNASFGVLRWRHHCRGCGYLICADCGPYFRKIPALKETRGSRLCTVCIVSQARLNAAGVERVVIHYENIYSPKAPKVENSSDDVLRSIQEILNDSGDGEDDEVLSLNALPELSNDESKMKRFHGPHLMRVLETEVNNEGLIPVLTPKCDRGSVLPQKSRFKAIHDEPTAAVKENSNKTSIGKHFSFDEEPAHSFTENIRLPTSPESLEDKNQSLVNFYVDFDAIAESFSDLTPPNLNRFGSPKTRQKRICQAQNEAVWELSHDEGSIYSSNSCFNSNLNSPIKDQNSFVGTPKSASKVAQFRATLSSVKERERLSMESAYSKFESTNVSPIEKENRRNTLDDNRYSRIAKLDKS